MDTAEPSEQLRRNVHEDEEIQWVVRPSRLAWFLSEGLWPVVGGLVVGAILATGAFVGLRQGLGESTTVAAGAGAVVFLVAVLRASSGVLARLAFDSTEYAATDARLIRHGGVFGQEMSSVPLEGVQDAEYEVGFAERLLDRGTVTLDTDRGYESLTLPYTPSPADVAREVRGVAMRAEREGTPSLDRGPIDEYTPGEGLATDDPAPGLERNVFEDEQLLWAVTPSRWARLLGDLPGAVVGSLVVAGVVGALAFAGAFLATRDPRLAGLVGAGVGTALFLLSVGTTVYVALLGTRQYAATDRRVLAYESALGKRLDAVPLVGVQDAEYGVSPLENVFEVGSVELDTHRGYESMRLSRVPRPPDVAREISRLANSDLARRPARAPGEVDVGDGVDPEAASEDLRTNLHSEEQLAWTITPDRTARLLSTLVGSVAGTALATVVLGSIAAVVVVGETGDLATGVLAAAGVFVLLVGLSALGAVGDFLFDSTEYALTNDRIVEYSGRFGRELSGVPLQGVQDAEYDVDLVERLFSVGDVTVDTFPDHGSVTLEAVANPADVARELSEAANAHRTTRDRGSRPAARTDAGSGDAAGAAEATAGDGRSDDGTGRQRPVETVARKRCPDCEATIDATAAYCPDCGADQPRPDPDRPVDCRHCGGAVDRADAFCRHCGTADPVVGAASGSEPESESESTPD